MSNTEPDWCADAEDGGGIPAVPPPCHQETCTAKPKNQNETSPPGGIAWDVKTHPESPIVARCDDAGEGLDICVGNETPVITSDTDFGQALLALPSMYRVRDADGNLCLVANPPALNYCECAPPVDPCVGAVGEGEDGTLHSSCGANACVTVKNEGAWPAKVIPKVTIRSAELRGGPATYMVCLTHPDGSGGTTTVDYDLFTEAGGEIKVQHIGTSSNTEVECAPPIQDANGNDVKCTVDMPSVGHVISGGTDPIDTGSYTIELGMFTLDPGEEAEYCVEQKVRSRGDHDPFPVTFGGLNFCADVSSIVSPASIRALTGQVAS